MASLHYRAGVDLREMAPQILMAWQVAAEVYEAHGYTAWATSLYRAGTWEATLLHGKGLAIDFGLTDALGRPIPDDAVDAIVAELQARLGRPGGGQFDVIDERPDRNPSSQSTGPHIHCEFDPK